MYQKPMSSSALLLGRTFLFVVISQLFLAGQASAQLITSAKQNEAKISVAIVDKEKNADLNVFRTTDLQHKDLKNNKGIWAIIEGAPAGVIKISWTTDSVNADLRIRLVPSPANAGWINPAKKKLLQQ